MTDLASRTYGFYSTAPKRQTPEPDATASAGQMFAMTPEPPAPADFPTAGSGPKLAPGDPRHGTGGGYTNWYCRCDDCKAANRDSQRRRRLARRQRPVPDHVHGTDNGYCNYYCKCTDCCAAHRARYERSYKPSPRRALLRAETEAMYADYTAGMSVEQVARKWGKSVGAVRSRFHAAGLKRRDTTGISAAMYIDYCTGMSNGDIAEKWGVTPQCVSRRFKELGVPLRPRVGGTVQVRVPKGTSFDEANAARTATAGKRRAEAARDALPRTVDRKHRQVLQLRIADPRASLTELGARCTPPMTKDSYASHLRRALANAGVTA